MRVKEEVVVEVGEGVGGLEGDLDGDTETAHLPPKTTTARGTATIKITPKTTIVTTYDIIIIRVVSGLLHDRTKSSEPLQWDSIVMSPQSSYVHIKAEKIRSTL